MKKVIFGSALFASGFLSVALLLAGTLSTELANDSARSLALWRLSYVGLMPFFYLSIALAATSRASVLSSPPEIPMTAVLLLEWSSRFLSPSD